MKKVIPAAYKKISVGTEGGTAYLYQSKSYIEKSPSAIAGQRFGGKSYLVLSHTYSAYSATGLVYSSRLLGLV